MSAMLSSHGQVLLHFSAHVQHFCAQIREAGAAAVPWKFRYFCKFKQHALMIDYSNFVVHITLFISQQVLLVIIKAICY